MTWEQNEQNYDEKVVGVTRHVRLGMGPVPDGHECAMVSGLAQESVTWPCVLVLFTFTVLPKFGPRAY